MSRSFYRTAMICLVKKNRKYRFRRTIEIRISPKRFHHKRRSAVPTRGICVVLCRVAADSLRPFCFKIAEVVPISSVLPSRGGEIPAVPRVGTLVCRWVDGAPSRPAAVRLTHIAGEFQSDHPRPAASSGSWQHPLDHPQSPPHHRDHRLDLLQSTFTFVSAWPVYQT